MNYKKKHLVDFVISRCDITDYPLTRVEVEMLTKKNLLEIIDTCDLMDELNYEVFMAKACKSMKKRIRENKKDYSDYKLQDFHNMMEAFAKNPRDIDTVLSLYEFVKCVPYGTIETPGLIAETEFLAVIDTTKARILLNYIRRQSLHFHSRLKDAYKK